jgi:hypothetical protein
MVLLSLLVAGCGTKFDQMSPAAQQDIIPSFQQGRTELDCQMACSWQWLQNRRFFNAMYNAGDWSDLALGVSKVGFQEDLAYFWLGRAAEGQGYTTAAIHYYQLANVLTRTPNSISHCINVIGEHCFGIDVLRQSFDRIKFLQRSNPVVFQPPPPRYMPPPVSPPPRPAPPNADTTLESPPSPTTVPFVPYRPAPPSNAVVEQPKVESSPAKIPDDDFELPPIRR